MQEDIKRRKKRAPIVWACVFVGLLAAVLAMLVFPLLGDSYGLGAAVVILVIYGLLILAVIVGVLAALAQRLREIDSGEEEEAKKY